MVGVASLAILAVLVIISIPWIISANAQLTLSPDVPRTNVTHTHLESTTVTITSPAKNYRLPVGVTLITGNASAAPGKTIRVVEAHVDKQPYFAAAPKTAGNWSHWSIKLTVRNDSPIGRHIIQARVTDSSGTRSWDSLPVVFNSNSSSLAAPANTTTTAAPANITTTAPANITTTAASPLPPPPHPQTNTTKLSSNTTTAANTTTNPSIHHKINHAPTIPGLIQ